MSCRHDLAGGTCLRCYPNTGTVDPGPEENYEDNLEGIGAVTRSENVVTLGESTTVIGFSSLIKVGDIMPHDVGPYEEWTSIVILEKDCRINQIEVPGAISPCFDIIDMKKDKDSIFVSSDPIPALIFSNGTKSPPALNLEMNEGQALRIAVKNLTGKKVEWRADLWGEYFEPVPSHSEKDAVETLDTIPVFGILRDCGALKCEQMRFSGRWIESVDRLFIPSTTAKLFHINYIAVKSIDGHQISEHVIERPGLEFTENSNGKLDMIIKMKPWHDLVLGVLNISNQNVWFRGALQGVPRNC